MNNLIEKMKNREFNNISDHIPNKKNDENK